MQPVNRCWSYVLPTRCYENSGVQAVRDLSIVAGYERVLAAHGMDSLDGLFDVPNDNALDKPGLSPWRERLRLRLDVDGVPRTFYLKRFHTPPRRVRRQVLRSGTSAMSLAGLEWTWTHRLAADGILCPQPVAFGEELCGSREVRSALLCAEVPGRSLEQWVQGGWPRERAVRLALIDRVAALVSRLHGRGYVHRDLYLSHLFCDATAQGDLEVRLIDLQRVFRPRFFQRRWIVKDLASLDYSSPSPPITRSDRIRWLTRYLGDRKLEGQARRLVYRIIGKSRAIARHEGHRLARWEGR